ncbi:nitrogenase cofactor biosynthesis protein NifB [Megasphaera cerevisiae]|jgi:MoaA/NifB/PqqE/SkfB family radical SAM enzyme|nr:nitrogenase cofactor biosynthesis protein NifB [Megasphaera cerevisiae]
MYLRKMMGADNVMSKFLNHPLTLVDRTQTHPCFTCGKENVKYARMHLPVAPRCNIQCNYCVRKFDCPNESRPGVTTKVLIPDEAFAKFEQVKKDIKNLTVVGIAGPGEALANFPAMEKVLTLIRKKDPDITFCLSTNGLMLPVYAQRLIELGVSHVTITINAVDPKIGAQIYKYVHYMGRLYKGESAAGILLGNQLSGLKYLSTHGVICKVNIVMLKGINDHHIETVVKTVKKLGAFITNIMQLIPVEGSAFEKLPLVSNREIMKMRQQCGIYVAQMMHCRQCRADAIGTLDQDVSMKYYREQPHFPRIQSGIPHTSQNGSSRVAVATRSGVWIDQHFGEAKELYIYESNGKEVHFIERRNIEQYCHTENGCDTAGDRIDKIINSIQDCQAVLSLRIGEVPLEKLKQKGITSIMLYDNIENGIKKALLQV